MAQASDYPVASSPPPPPNRTAIPPGPLSRGTSPILRALEEGQFEEQESRFLTLHLPVLVMVVGLVVSVLLWITLVTRTPGAAWLWIGGAVVTQLLVFAPLTLVALWAMAQWFEMSFGGLFGVSLKIVSVTLGAAGMADALFVYSMVQTEFDWGLLVAAYGYYLVITGPFMALFFGISIYETALAVFLLYLPRVAAIYLLVAAAPHLFP